MLGIGFEWWILYALMLVGVIYAWAILMGIRISNARLEALFNGLDIIHRDAEEMKRILQNME